MSVNPGRFSADIDGDFVVFGLAAAGRHAPAASKAHSAAARIGATGIDEPAVAPY